jgi:hypothetical protein
MKDVCPKRVRPVLDREEELTKMKETMLQYVNMSLKYHTGREVIER